MEQGEEAVELVNARGAADVKPPKAKAKPPAKTKAAAGTAAKAKPKAVAKPKPKADDAAPKS